MKQIFCIFFLMSSVFAFADCITLYSSVTYAFSHSGRSLKADNFDHQRYYAKRALRSLEKAEEQMGSCDCAKINDIMYDVRENLERAIDPDDWDTGRFYVKKAREYLSETMTALDVCAADTDPVPASVPEEEKESDYNDKKMTGENPVTLAEKQQALKKEQEALIAKQKKLERQLEEQRRIEQQLAAARQQELEAQKALKVKAEIGLYKMESAAMELISAFNCEKEFAITEAYKRGDEVLEEESLEETREFYKHKFREVMERMEKKLEECNID
ncbi:hypothetical protein [Sinomicrobium weinanense]|uniref:Uncharacterized protein n=1 Tax=Sinomicrobium weinanense TaxID=2842200 RepID=A0A926JVN3_9FLAO|nr:hypothetical protein [Sinomicrobium weinanense]MBC9798320.1 hypothetical protein [Sinomicrobium weinanense]MBU3125598.1 hypothetical protein [Sinomicrobium weinanense]